jgi:phosphatidylglycerol---prolipoprotein diacylglyceryl transferase
MSFPYLTDLLNAVLGTHWTLPVPTFGVAVAAAIVVAASVARIEVRRKESLGKLPASTHSIVGDLALVCALAGIVGARVFHIFDYSEQFMADPMAMIFSRAGFSIYGGLFFGVLAGAVFLKRRGVPIAPMLDATAPALMLGYAVGRLGCQLSGDGDWGIASNMALKPSWLPGWLWAETYHGNIVGAVLPDPGVYPTPIYESAAALVLFGALWALRSDTQRPAFLFSVYLLLAGFERLLVEKIRINVRHDWLGIGLTQAEAISVLLVVAGLAGVLLTLRGRRVWLRTLLALGVVAALSACVPL